MRQANLRGSSTDPRPLSMLEKQTTEESGKRKERGAWKEEKGLQTESEQAKFLETTRSQMDLITNAEAGVLRRKSNRTTY